MKLQIHRRINVLLFAMLVASVAPGVNAAETTDSPERYNVVWDSPSKDQSGSMPYHASVPKPTLSNIAYGSHERQVLDFWKAPSASADKPAPLVFYIHGGSWLSGSKEIINGCVDVNALLKAGISVVAINYRYVSQAEALGIVPSVKAPLNDAARALQFVRSKAKEWDIDKIRIGATGESAGGCSSLWLAYHDDMAAPESADPIARESTRLFCAGVRVPQTSLDPQQMREWMPTMGYGGHAFGKKNFQEFFDAREDLLPWIEEYSPYAHVSKDDPPVSMFYNKYLEKDHHSAHSPQFAFYLQKHCKELGIFCDVLFDRAPGYRQNEATFFLIKTLNSTKSEAKNDTVKYDANDYNKQLPGFKKGTRLVFIGDSITDMARGRNEKDRNHYLGHSFVFMIAGHLGISMPEAQLDFYNRGIGGDTVANLRKRWQKDAIDMRPDILTILVGTNDVGKKVTPAAFEVDYRAILDASMKANPDLKVILLDPFVLKSGGLKSDSAWSTRRTATDKLRPIVSQLAKEFNAVHIKTQDIFDAAAEAVTPEYWMWDGVHPLPQGHELIARHWLKAVSARWPKGSEQAVSKDISHQTKTIFQFTAKD
jgi:lysophospholipase L1-like esterase